MKYFFQLLRNIFDFYNTLIILLNQLKNKNFLSKKFIILTQRDVIQTTLARDRQHDMYLSSMEKKKQASFSF